MAMFPVILPDETLDIIDDVRIIQKKRGHRFTTDSVLLAKLSMPKRHARVLELGAGCGIVSILLARQEPTIHITAGEIQKEIAELAERNILLNGLKDQIRVVNQDIKDLPHILPASHFDYIIANPPYRPLSAGRTSPVRERTVARKEMAVTIRDIIGISQRLLKIRGRLSMIYSAERLVDLFSTMRLYGIEPKAMECIYTRKDREARLVWVEGVKEGRPGIKIEATELYLP